MRPLAFDWDQWNIQKNEQKHGVSVLEAESCFFDPHHTLYRDTAHSTIREQRYILYAKGMEGRILMIGFTIRRHKVRIITARPASRKERAIYEKTTPRNP